MANASLERGFGKGRADRLFARGSVEGGTYGARDLLTDLFFNKKIFLTALILPILAVSIFAIRMPDIFEADARLLVLVSREHMMQTEIGVAGFAAAIDVPTRIILAESEIMKSRHVREGTLEKIGPFKMYPDLADHYEDARDRQALVAAVAEFDRNFKIDVSPTTGIIALRFRHSDAVMTADVLNTFIDLFLKKRQEVFYSAAPRVLRTELDSFEAEISKLDERIQHLLKEADVGDFAIQRKAFVDELASLQNEQIKSGVMQDSFRRQIEELDDLMQLIPERVDVFVEDAATNALNNTLDLVRQLEMEKAELSEHFKPDSRFLQLIDRRLVQAHEIVESLRHSGIGRERQGRNIVYDQLMKDLIDLRTALAAESETLDARAYAILELKEKIDTLSVYETQFERYQRRREAVIADYKAYAQQLGEERVAGALSSARKDPAIRVIERAVVPIKGNSTKLKIILVGVVAGLLLASGATFLASIGCSIFLTPAQSERDLGFPVLVSILQKRLKEAGLLSLFNEMRRLHFVLGPPVREERCVGIQFVGAAGGEGVSSIAREFALVAAQTIKGPVLLLDLKSEGQSQYDALIQRDTTDRFGALGPALELPIKASIWSMASPRLQATLPNPQMTFHRAGSTNLIVSRMSIDFEQFEGTPQLNPFADFWEELHKVFRMVIVDTPPVAEDVNGLAVCSLMDATLLVIAAEKTRRPVAKNLRNQVLASGGHIAGSVLNRRRMYIPRLIYRFL